MHNIFGIPFTDGGDKSEATKEREAAPAPDKQDHAEDKKVLSTRFLVVLKKPRSQSLIPVYVRVKMYVATTISKGLLP